MGGTAAMKQHEVKHHAILRSPSRPHKGNRNNQEGMGWNQWPRHGHGHQSFVHLVVCRSLRHPGRVMCACSASCLFVLGSNPKFILQSTSAYVSSPSGIQSTSACVSSPSSSSCSLNLHMPEPGSSVFCVMCPPKFSVRSGSASSSFFWQMAVLFDSFRHMERGPSFWCTGLFMA